ncbi:MAG: glycoside hydrolase family 43 protein [Ruminococcaceae bacterium]|nr:glycoside hydrolase family 43 protein [Oscillospiraceae bacterium]
MLIKKNPVLTGFHPDPKRLLCAKGAVSCAD